MPGTLEGIDGIGDLLLNGIDEVINLGGVLFSAQVKVHRVCEVRDVFHIPAPGVVVGTVGGFEMHLQLIGITDDLSFGTDHRQGGRHLAVGVITPVHRQYPGDAGGQFQQGEDRVFHMFGEKGFEDRSFYPGDGAEGVIDQVNDMGGIVHQATAAFRRVGSPVVLAGAHHHRSVGFAGKVEQVTEEAAVEDSFEFAEGADEFIVVAHLVDQVFAA